MRVEGSAGGGEAKTIVFTSKSLDFLAKGSEQRAVGRGMGGVRGGFCLTDIAVDRYRTGQEVGRGICTLVACGLGGFIRNWLETIVSTVATVSVHI